MKKLGLKTFTLDGKSYEIRWDRVLLSIGMGGICGIILYAAAYIGGY